MFGCCRKWGTPLLLLLVLALVAGMGCRKELPELFDRNIPPETYISEAPIESLFDGYRVHVSWYGVDPDGEIAYFLWAWTDSSDAWFSAWNPESNAQDRILRSGDFDATHLTTRTDSIFVLQANDNGGMSRDLTFNITAVDDQGRRDPVPARLYFNASVDHRPEIHWLDEDPGDRDESVTWVGSVQDTLDVGQSFACGFWASTENGYIKGFQWTYGNDPNWYPKDENNQTVWTYQHPDLADQDTILLDFANDVTGDEPFMADYYRSGSFRIKAKCVDRAGVESEVNTHPDRLSGVIIPILNRDPDTRLRQDIPVVLSYKPFGSTGYETVYPEVVAADIGEDGYHYELTDPIPWGQDVRFEVHMQGWDIDDPLLAEGPDINTRFQIAYSWKAKNLNLLELESAFMTGNSLGRYPAGGDSGQAEDLSMGFGEAGAQFQMNIGPMDYRVKGYTIDHFGRVDGTPVTLDFQGGFPSIVDSVVMFVKIFDDEGDPVYSDTSVNLDEFILSGEPVHVQIVGRPYFGGTLPSEWLSWNEETRSIRIQAVDATLDYPVIADFLFTIRVYGHDDPRNGENAQLASIYWDMEDSDYENNGTQFGFAPRFTIEEGGYILTWRTLSTEEITETGHCDITFAVRDTAFVVPPELSAIMAGRTPAWLGDKQLTARFRNTLPSDIHTEMIENAQQRILALNNIGRTSEPITLNFDIQYINWQD